MAPSDYWLSLLVIFSILLLHNPGTSPLGCAGMLHTIVGTVLFTWCRDSRSLQNPFLRRSWARHIQGIVVLAEVRTANAKLFYLCQSGVQISPSQVPKVASEQRPSKRNDENCVEIQPHVATAWIVTSLHHVYTHTYINVCKACRS